MHASLYRLYHMVVAARFRFRRRLTSGGMLVMVALVVVAGLGLDTEQTLAYAAFALLASLLFVALCFTPFFRGRFRATRLLPRYASVGAKLSYRVELINLTNKWQRGLELMDSLGEPRLSQAEFELRTRAARESFRIVRSSSARRAMLFDVMPVPAMPPSARVEVTLAVLPLRRGILQLETLVVARPDPFGLIRSLVLLRLPQSVVVLPKRYPVNVLRLGGVTQYQPGGVALAGSVGESEEFVALREYRRGDPLRNIHWKSWARLGTPIVKEFQNEFFVRHALVLDTMAGSADLDRLEEAVSVAASFACHLETQETLLDLMFVGPRAVTFTAGRGVGHTEQMLEILAAVTPSPRADFTVLRNLVLLHAGEISGCICVFLRWDAARQDLVRELQAQKIPLLVLIIEPDGGVMLEPGPMAGDPENFRVLRRAAEVSAVEVQ